MSLKAIEKDGYDVSELWHRRFGHCNYFTMKLLKSNNLVTKLPSIYEHTDVCEVCQLGKQTRLPFPLKSTKRAYEKLELIHSNVCGPMSAESLNGSKYFVLFIDDYTRLTWIYFIKFKSDVFSVFKKFKASVELELRWKVKCLRTDNGREFNSDKFEAFLSAAGIKHQFTVPYSPQQNGVCERKNKTILNMARALEKLTPYEAWYNVKPIVDHLKVFGCICYVHVPEAKKTKLEPRAELRVFLGYSLQSKGYRVFNLSSKKVQAARDIRFDEQVYWN
ncbi:Integrase [Theobroma cacao]|nr:Integrase [Theobroma cacao]